MANLKTPGLYKRRGVWHMDKVILGRRICESTHAHRLIEAEQYVAHRIEEIRQSQIYGVRSEHIFREAGEKFLIENQHRRNIKDDAHQLKALDPFIGDLSLKSVHMGSLQSFINARRIQGVKNRTINYGLEIIRRILNLAASEWMDQYGMAWIDHSPKIKLLPRHDERPPYPLSWSEQDWLFNLLPAHLERMALFAVNTGCREHEICSLKWEWEQRLESYDTSVFIVPGRLVKNGEDRLVVLNKIALAVIESARGNHPEYVFTYHGKPINSMNNTAWKGARKLANLDVRVHDLKHTFGRRLRAAGVSREDRRDLLGHKSSHITTHYSAAEIEGLLKAANRACDLKRSTPILRVIKGTNGVPRKTLQDKFCPAKVPQGKICSEGKIS